MDCVPCLSSSSSLSQLSSLHRLPSGNSRFLVSSTAFDPPLIRFRGPRCFAQLSLTDGVTAVSTAGNGTQPSISFVQTKNIWVNPQSTRAVQVMKKRQESRYSFLFELAKSLDACSATAEEVSRVFHRECKRLSAPKAVSVLNLMTNPLIAPIALRMFLGNLKPENPTALYNVTMKVLRIRNRFEEIEKLFDEMLEGGVRPDNRTFSTIISCARSCSLPEKALEWCTKMPTFDCRPDVITYSILIDLYGRSGKVDVAMAMFERARNEGVIIDPVIFSLLIKFHGASKNVSACLEIYRGMKGLGINPDLTAYNRLFTSLARARKAWFVEEIHKELIETGVELNRGTHVRLLQIYGNVRHGRKVMEIYTEMKNRGMHMDTALYNKVLAVCADVGFVDEAVRVFHDMDGPEEHRADGFTFAAMIAAYSRKGNVAGAETMFDEMTEKGIAPTVSVLGSLVECYGRARCGEKVIATIDRALNLGAPLDDPFFLCVLRTVARTPKGERSELIASVAAANAGLSRFLGVLVGEGSSAEERKMEACRFFDSANAAARKAYFNSFVDVCGAEMVERGREVLDIGFKIGIYRGVESKTATQWSLHLKTFSPFSGVILLDEWLQKVSGMRDELPPVLAIHTGHGRLIFSELMTAVKSRLEEIHAPFLDDPKNVGWFLTTATAARSWLVSTSRPL